MEKDSICHSVEQNAIKPQPSHPSLKYSTVHNSIKYSTGALNPTVLILCVFTMLIITGATFLSISSLNDMCVV